MSLHITSISIQSPLNPVCLHCFPGPPYKSFNLQGKDISTPASNTQNVIEEHSSANVSECSTGYYSANSPHSILTEEQDIYC
jgi:hypothetical protein